ncbi:MAG TPA: MBL fold metallo-hydrolase [Candidatus Limnocylindrales bacterium]|nr:MBL fold metallo-hydrolase [Candidatus Limnocylindrales bacterium]
MTRVAEGIHRVGRRSTVNAYLLEEGGEVTVIDAGLRGQWSLLLAELGTMGRSLADIRAVVLTHGHSDHIGFAERLRTERNLPVWVHDLDSALARGEIPNPAKQAGGTRPIPFLSFLLYALRNGARPTPIQVVSTYGDGATLEVPGTPRVILAPGHTPGSCALHVASRSVLFAGDTLGTLSVTTGATGPRLSPFNADRAQALASLQRLWGLDAELVLPGHGDPWTLGIDSAIVQAREAEAVLAPR